MDDSWVLRALGVSESDPRPLHEVREQLRSLLGRAAEPSAAALPLSELASSAARTRGIEWRPNWITVDGGLAPEGVVSVTRLVEFDRETVPSIRKLLNIPSSRAETETDLLHEIAASICPDALTASAGAEDLVLGVARVIDPSSTDAARELYFAAGVPSVYFYDQVLALLERQVDPGSELRSGDEQGDDVAEDEAGPADFTGVRSEVTTWTIATLFQRAKSGILILSPPWQRRSIWSVKKQRKLIESILLGIPLPSIILHKKEGPIEVIDGKQRLTAIVEFMRNEFCLERYQQDRFGSELAASSRRFFDRGDKPSLSADMKTKIEDTSIPLLIFHDVPDRRLRRIFELYNVSSTRLNAAEIRNAVYQGNAVHRMLFALAEDVELRDPTHLYLVDADAQRRFTAILRQTLALKDEGRRERDERKLGRYVALDFLCRYLGYSRAVHAGGSSFTAITTAAAVNRYLDSDDCASQDPAALAREIVDAFERAEEWFDLDDQEHEPFHRWEGEETRKRKFNGLVATTNMVVGSMLSEWVRSGIIDRSGAARAAREAFSQARYPSGQTSATIWDYQAQVALAAAREAGVAQERLSVRWATFLGRMQQVHTTQADART